MGSFFLGMGGAVLLQLLPLGFDDSGFLGWPPFGWIAALMALLAFVSFLDDRTKLPVALRFGIQALAAFMMVEGARISVSSIPFPLLGTVDLGWFSIVVSITFLIWMTNLYNFMDGMDGFAGGMTLVGGLALGFLAAKGNAGTISILSFLLAGAAAGFLVHNFPPARIFMGDVGSIPIGFFFGAVILLGSRDQLFDIWVPLIVFSPFIVDATATLCRRLLTGEKVWEAHRTHYYQRVVLLGWGHHRTVLAEYGLMLFCAGLAWLYHVGTDSIRLIVLAVWCLVFAGLMAWIVMAERVTGRRQAVTF
jgi:UDP-N-acetylmuramyl pentapeptide phosphotransferase/UDP-N-acetylglucosamine-1-phosphate transferase